MVISSGERLRRMKLSKKLKKFFAVPKHRLAISKRIKKYWAVPGSAERQSKLKKKYWTPTKRKEASKRWKKIYLERPEIKEKIDLSVSSWWREHPDVKKEYAIRAVLQLMSDPEHYKKFMAGGTNPEKRKIKTIQGWLVKSIGEKEISEFLSFRKIKAEYESITLYLDGWICTPDFFLPESKVFIEYYGGHPSSWRKKVVKNRIYGKYKIPCIFITPSELGNLDYYILNDLKKISNQARKFNIKKFLKPRLSKSELKKFLYIIGKHDIKLPKETAEYIEKLKKRYRIKWD